MIKTSDYDYVLPQSLIAQTPLEPRDSSRLLVLRRGAETLEHRFFRDIGDYLRRGDLLVLNQTRVIPARIFARKESGGRVQLLLLRRRDARTWETLVGGKGLSAGKRLRVEDGPAAEVLSESQGAERTVRFSEPIEPYFSESHDRNPC